MIYTNSDGGARGNPGPAAAAIVVEKDGKVIHKESKYLGRGTNNEAEYSGAILGLEWVSKNITGTVSFLTNSSMVWRPFLCGKNPKKRKEKHTKLLYGLGL